MLHIAGAQYGKVAILDDAGMSDAAWSVWAALCTFCDWECTKNGKPIRSKADTCYPSKVMIAKRAHTSTSTVKRALRELERLDYVRTLERKGDTSQYMLYPFGNAPSAKAATAEFNEDNNTVMREGINSVLAAVRGYAAAKAKAAY